MISPLAQFLQEQLGKIIPIDTLNVVADNPACEASLTDLLPPQKHARDSRNRWHSSNEPLLDHDSFQLPPIRKESMLNESLEDLFRVPDVAPPKFPSRSLSIEMS
jgi:hypothetical protein